MQSDGGDHLMPNRVLSKREARCASLYLMATRIFDSYVEWVEGMGDAVTDADKRAMRRIIRNRADGLRRLAQKMDPVLRAQKETETDGSVQDHCVG